jgi:hypothetical protein
MNRWIAGFVSEQTFQEKNYTGTLVVVLTPILARNVFKRRQNTNVERRKNVESLTMRRASLKSPILLNLVKHLVFHVLCVVVVVGGNRMVLILIATVLGVSKKKNAIINKLTLMSPILSYLLTLVL